MTLGKITLGELKLYKIPMSV